MDLANSIEIVVTGGSAGGLAVLSWVDVIANMFDSSKTRVYGLPDSGLFLDLEHT